MSINPDDILIRTHLKPGDLGYIAYLHGKIYAEENEYTLSFERYVLEGLSVFAASYNIKKDRIWICEHSEKIIGSLVAFHSELGLQLRFFLISTEYRGLGLGNILMKNFIEFMHEKKYSHSFLWTTHEQVLASKLYMKYGFRFTEEKESSAFGKNLKEQRFDLFLC
ncbi:MAG: GNAT family N-acetyltransferase [Chitinophagaceae bacterium]